MNEDENVSIWNKTAADLTVADQCKVAAVIVTAVVAVVVVPGTVIFGVEKLRNFRQKRQIAKQDMKDPAIDVEEN